MQKWIKCPFSRVRVTRYSASSVRRSVGWLLVRLFAGEYRVCLFKITYSVPSRRFLRHCPMADGTRLLLLVHDVVFVHRWIHRIMYLLFSSFKSFCLSPVRCANSTISVPNRENSWSAETCQMQKDFMNGSNRDICQLKKSIYGNLSMEAILSSAFLDLSLQCHFHLLFNHPFIHWNTNLNEFGEALHLLEGVKTAGHLEMLNHHKIENLPTKNFYIFKKIKENFYFLHF